MKNHETVAQLLKENRIDGKITFIIQQASCFCSLIWTYSHFLLFIYLFMSTVYSLNLKHGKYIIWIKHSPSLDDRYRHSFSSLNLYNFICIFGFLVFISQLFSKNRYRPSSISTTCFVAVLPPRVRYRLILFLSISRIFCHIFNHWWSIGLWNRILDFIYLRINLFDFLTFYLYLCVLRLFYAFV